MLERHITALRTDDAGTEDAAATRERLKAAFPPGAARRMTQLGMLMGNLLNDLAPAEGDTLIYATQYAESRTLETYLESFPSASPIGFQTSIHPGAVQQGLIRRAQPIGEFFPMAGSGALIGQALLAAFLAPATRTLLCAGEERGTWLASIDGASERAFASVLSLSATPPDGASAPGRITLEPAAEPHAALEPAAWFALLHTRQNFSGVIAPGWRATLSWR